MNPREPFPYPPAPPRTHNSPDTTDHPPLTFRPRLILVRGSSSRALDALLTGLRGAGFILYGDSQLETVMAVLDSGRKVVVAGEFPTRMSMAPYLALGVPTVELSVGGVAP